MTGVSFGEYIRLPAFKSAGVSCGRHRTVREVRVRYSEAAGKMVEVSGRPVPGVENLLSVNLSAVK